MTTVPELEHLVGDAPWTTDAIGCPVRREDLIDRVINESVRVVDGRLSDLVAQIEADTRKSFSKAKILAMIEEYL